MKIILIGAGRWGQKYIKTLNEKFNVDLFIGTRHTWKQLLNESPEGVIISTSPDSHIEIAEYALDRNIPVMIEKPLSLSLNEAERLKKYNIPILVNHIHLFSDFYQEIKQSINPKQITKINSEGFNNGPIRNYSSLWDYGPHDLSLILDLSQQIPHQIIINEGITKNGSLFNIKLRFESFESESIIGNGGNYPSRNINISHDNLNIFYDDISRPENHNQPLYNSIKVFLDSINGKDDYRLGVDLSLKILYILEKCQKQLNRGII